MTVSQPRSSLHVVESPSPTDSGRAPVRLLVHGSMDRAGSFGRLAAALGRRAVVTYDRRGYAGSARRAPSEDFGVQVDDLLEVVDGRRVVALGHSFGGCVVLAAAAAHPELFVAAVVWEPPMPWLAYWPADAPGGLAAASRSSPEDAAEGFMVAAVGERVWRRLPAATRAQRRAEGPALVAEMRALRSGGAPWDPASVRVPVIVGTGGRSRPHHARAAAELADTLPAGVLRVVPDAAHGAHLTHPVALAALLTEAQVLGTTPPAAAESRGRPSEEDDA